MTRFKNTFEGGSNGTNISVANSGGASGDPWSYIFINGASTPSGGSALTYASSAALNGSLGGAAAAGTATNYLRWDDAGGPRGVIRIPVRFDEGITNGTVINLAGIHSSSSKMASIAVRGSGTSYRIAAGDAAGADISGSRWLATLSTLYWVELAATKGTSTSDGTLALKVFASDQTTELWSWSSSAENTGTANVGQARFSTLAAYGISYDDVQFDSDLPSGWLGPIVATNQAPTVSITTDKTTLFPGEVTTVTPTATDSDGTITSRSVTCDIGGILTGTWPTYTLTAPARLADQTAILTVTATDNLGLSSTDTRTITLKASMSKMYTGTTWIPLIESLITD